MKTSSLVAAITPSIAGAVLMPALVLAWPSTAAATPLSDFALADRGSEPALSQVHAPSRILDYASDFGLIETEAGAIRFASDSGGDDDSESDAVELAVSEPKDDADQKESADSKDKADDTEKADDQSDKDKDKDKEAKDKPPRNPITKTDYEALVNNAAGFGQQTIGGLGGDICRVKSLDDAGGGTLRNCATKGARWVVFDVSGEIALETPIRIANDTTIDGRGADITLTKHGLSTAGRENIIIYNLKIERIEGDGIAVYEAKNIWISHVTVGATSDGAIDVTGHSLDITVSWTHLKEQNKTMLIGNDNSKVEDVVMKVTLHHNWYDNTVRRNPLVRFGKVHMYNNVHTNWGDQFGEGDAVNSVYRAQLLLEGNVYEAGSNKQAVHITVPGWLEVPGYVNARGNSPINGARVFSSEPQNVFEATTYYTYRLDTPTSDLANTVKTYAGWQPASFFEGDIYAAEASARGSDEDESGDGD